MNGENVTFNLDTEKKNTYRDYILNQAVDTEMKIYCWQLEEITDGIAEAEAGDFASPEEVNAVFAQLCLG